MINLNQGQGHTIEEYEEKRFKYRIRKNELTLKEVWGMPMTEEERKLSRKIQGLIDQCDDIIDYMVIEGMYRYEWFGGDD